MKISPSKRWKSGFVSYVLVLATGAVLTFMMFYAYKRAMAGNAIQTKVQLRLDYAEKEEAILRSIVAITPNRAIRAMQSGSNANTTTSDPLRWQNIFTEAIALANAGTSISSNVVSSLAIPNLKYGNSGDSALGTPSRIFTAISPDTGYISVGINRSLGTGYPPPLTSSDTTTSIQDITYPIISDSKRYDTLAQADLISSKLNGGYGLSTTTYPKFNRLRYPDINFGYAKPGDPFVAKRNWWAFSVDVADHDNDKTLISLAKRNFVLSIYEIPSQLAISASSFMTLGSFAGTGTGGSGGQAWDPSKVTITGGVFAGNATVEGSTAITALATRRGMTLSNNASIGGQTFANSPFTPGIRESYQLTQGTFFPVSLASESGRAAFVPINRGKEYFDRFDTSNATTESNAVSTTTWNNYSVGALQCAMRLDITQRSSATNNTPTMLRFNYMKAGVRTDLAISLNTGAEAGLPPGYIYCATEGRSYNFDTTVVDVAYGKSNSFAFQTAVTGNIAFTNARFGDPLVGTFKFGYYKPSYPFEKKTLPSGKMCIAIYPKRFKNFLALLGADTAAVNNSLVVNVDYTTTTGSVLLTKPAIPCTDLDYGVILKECDDLTTFTKGFSLVTNLRLYIGDDFNTTLYKNASPAIAVPTGYPGTADTYYPPCSLFSPEKRYGVETNPFAVSLSGQVGSLAAADRVNAADPALLAVRPLDSKNSTGTAIAADRITMNLRPISHPADIPPITMMNWLILLEERRKEYY